LFRPDERVRADNNSKNDFSVCPNVVVDDYICSKRSCRNVWDLKTWRIHYDLCSPNTRRHIVLKHFAHKISITLLDDASMCALYVFEYETRIERKENELLRLSVISTPSSSSLHRWFANEICTNETYTRRVHYDNFVPPIHTDNNIRTRSIYSRSICYRVLFRRQSSRARAHTSTFMLLHYIVTSSDASTAFRATFPAGRGYAKNAEPNGCRYYVRTGWRQ